MPAKIISDKECFPYKFTHNNLKIGHTLFKPPFLLTAYKGGIMLDDEYLSDLTWKLFEKSGNISYYLLHSKLRSDKDEKR